MKTSLLLKGIEVAGVKIGEVAVTHEYSASEAINLMMGGKEFIKSFIKDIPEMATDLKKAYDVVEAINNDVVAEDVVEVADKSVIDRYIDMLSICNSKDDVDRVLIEAIRDEDVNLDDMTKIKDEYEAKLKEIKNRAVDLNSVEAYLRAIAICDDEAELNEIVSIARLKFDDEDYIVIAQYAETFKMKWHPMYNQLMK